MREFTIERPSLLAVFSQKKKNHTFKRIRVSFPTVAFRCHLMENKAPSFSRHKNMNDTHRILRTVLNELDHFENTFQVSEPAYPKYLPEAVAQIRDVHRSQLQLLSEPFISYVKVRQRDDDDGWSEKNHLFCRNYTPMGMEPLAENAQFANRNANIGNIASGEIGDEIPIKLPNTIKTRYYEVIEKNIFTPSNQNDAVEWDATKNNIVFKLEGLFIQSARAFVSKIGTKSKAKKIPSSKPG